MSEDRALDAQVRADLLAYLADRLGTGEVLVTPAQFQAAAQEGFQVLTGVAADAAVQAQIIALLAEQHRQDPAVLLAPGVENWISRSVLARVRKEGWGVTEVQEHGTGLIRQFLREPKSRALLDQLGVPAKLINMTNCHRFVAYRIAGKQDDGHRRAAARLARLGAVRPAPAPPTAEDGAAAAEARVQGLLQGEVALPDGAEAARRKAAEKQTTAELHKRQMSELIAHLDNYVSLGRISAEDAERLGKLHEVEEAVHGGRMDRDQGSKIRNSILAGTARDHLERSVRKVVDHAVAYLQVYHALRRIDSRFDPALGFLARHGAVLNQDGGEQAPAGLGQIVESLAADQETLRLLIDMMDRKEAEVRMIAANLPPYNHIVRRDQGRIDRVAVDEAFVEALRTTTPDELAAHLHAADKQARARPAAAILSLTVLIGRLVKPTPIRKELRLLKVNLIIEEFYQATDDVEQARQRAQEFLKARLRSLYPDLSSEETQVLQARGEEIIQQVEDRVLAERRASGQERTATTQAPGADELSVEEQGRGVQLQRILVRSSGGQIRQVPFKIMPDTEKKERFVIVQRDPDSGELVPVLRRGAKRYVERGRDGTWRLARDG